MNKCKPVKTPMVPNPEIMKRVYSTKLQDIFKAPYREAIGSLLYLSIRTSPDISVAFGILAKAR
jgi:hypothetical protein